VTTEECLSGKRLWKIASEIRDRLVRMQTARYGDVQREVGNLLQNQEELASVHRRLRVCLSRGWLGAATRMAEQIQRLFRELLYSSQDAERAGVRPEVQPPNVRDVLEELLQAEEEFEHLRYDPEDGVLAVTTDPIELEGMYLGDFEIRLRIEALGDSQHGTPYRVVALDPQPSARNDAVTHPHVSEDRLCAGDAAAAVDAALASGRICDFLLLVRSVLTTYNSESAYVRLEDWAGAACSDCGATIGGDDTYYCTSCDAEFCSECTSSCARCDETTCLGCLSSCPVCGDSVCPACMDRCPECREPLCCHCREERQCPCQQEPSDEENQDEPDANTSPNESNETPDAAGPAGTSEQTVHPAAQTP